MKNYIILSVAFCLAFAGYIAGQNNSKPIEPCCCKHMQQIAEDIKAIREFCGGTFVPPEIKSIEFENINIEKSKLTPNEIQFNKAEFPKVAKPAPKKVEQHDLKYFDRKSNSSGK